MGLTDSTPPDTPRMTDRYSYQTLDNENIEDLRDALLEWPLVGIVDERSGGIVAYCGQNMASTLISSLAAAEQAKEAHKNLIGLLDSLDDHVTAEDMHTALMRDLWPLLEPPA